MKYKPTQYVYFIKPVGSDGPVKIGCSLYPKSRVASIRLWSPVELRLVAEAPGSFAHENHLHWIFVSDRLHGEWFNHSDDLEKVIQYVLSKGKLPNLGKLQDSRKLTAAQGRHLHSAKERAA